VPDIFDETSSLAALALHLHICPTSAMNCLRLSLGIGTLPNLLALGVAAGSLGRWLHRPQVRRLAGAGVIILGLITLWRAW